MIRQYDTVKDKQGNRYRVAAIITDEHANLKAKLKGVNIDGSPRRGVPRTVPVKDLDRDYERVNLAPVEVSHLEQHAQEVVEHMAEKCSKVGIDPKDQLIDAVGRATFGEKTSEEKPLRDIRAIDVEIMKDEMRALKKTISKQHDLIADKDKQIAVLKNSVKELKDLCAELGDEKAELAKKIEQQEQAADPSVLRELDGAKAANRALMSELEERDDDLRALRKKYEIAEHKIMGMVELVRAVMEGRRMP